MRKLPTEFALLCCMGVAALLAAGPANAGWVGPKLAGAWEIVGTPDATACGPTASFTNVATIGLDGMIVNVDPEVGTGAGQGYRIGKSKYVLGFWGFIATPVGTLRYEVQSTLKLLNPGELKGRFRTTVTDPNGVLPDCIYEGDISAERLVPMPY